MQCIHSGEVRKVSVKCILRLIYFAQHMYCIFPAILSTILTVKRVKYEELYMICSVYNWDIEWNWD